MVSSILLNSEAWVNLTDKDIRGLEQTDEILLSKVTESEANTSNTFKYLELGILPLRFEIMKRQNLFLQYVLKQDKSSMIYRVFDATRENPIKNYFVKICENYLKSLDIKLSFRDIELMGNWVFKNLMIDKVKVAGFKYMIALQKKESKILHINSLDMQEYL